MFKVLPVKGVTVVVFEARGYVEPLNTSEETVPIETKFSVLV